MRTVWLAIPFALLLYIIIMMIRNELVYRIRMKAIDIAYFKTKDAITQGYYTNYFEQLKHFGGYNKMLFDITKWTYKQFYPNW